MATSVEHELSNPLAYVQSNVGFLVAGLDRVDAALQEGDLGPELASQVEEMVEVVDEVRLGTERIRQIISDLGASLSQTLVVATGEGDPPGRPEPEGGAAAQRARVLVVDDEVLVGRAIKRVLGRKHEVVTAIDGREALQLLEAGEAFDLVLCDLMMPGVSGVDLYERLKARSPEAAGRMVFLTGGAFTGAARQFLDSVPNRRLEKPFDTKALEALVDALLEE
jgi:CheY-like chemotaxis protein